MPINFIPNDPLAGATAPGIRVQPKRPDRPAARSGFTFTGVQPEAVAVPGSPQFLFWQCREAAIAAVEAWEASAGNHTKWQGNRSKLPLKQDAGEDLNAFYDRASFSFFHKAVAGTTYFSGESTDVVSHEVGHGLLDSIRPDFFSVNFLEVGAFHEAFGDCMALLTALNDSQTRTKLLDVTADLRKRNFLESTAEQLSFAIKQIDPNHNAAEPRHAFNKLQYQLPQSLPDDGGPGVLINEVHSFGMLFTGCFWDLLVNMFAASATHTSATLLTSARAAGRILIAGAKGAIVTPRFLQAVGRAMVLADQTLNAGANRDHIRLAFQAHNILLGTNTMIAPAMSLAGAAPKGAVLSAATRRDLLDRLKSPKGAKLSLTAESVFGTPMVSAMHTRSVSLSSVSDSLKGVVATAYEPVMIGGSGTRAAVMGHMPNSEDTDSEVQAFAGTLLAHDRIDFGGKPKAKGIVNLSGKLEPAKTHAIKSVGGKKTLVRVRFVCRGCGLA